MPGIRRGRDINESGAKSVTVVTSGDARSITVEERLTSLAQFERLVVDVSRAEDWRGLVNTLSGALEAKRTEVASEHFVARVRIAGPSPLTWNILNDIDLLKTELDHRGEVIGKTWIEKVEVDSDDANMNFDSGSANAISELARLITTEVVDSEAFMLVFRTVAEELRAQMPAELRHAFGENSADFERVLSDLKHEGARVAVARLLMAER